ncbi:382_t:CDS:2 [Diversispora eburnea]|uniref:382_t:CDS:1 n=1 Tax=Diversispora eburnea TaxID=1213867 RepID=A0A9N8VB05_9GLOM|nr:382_t:CDS:2 [Diversispora eburnea]
MEEGNNGNNGNNQISNPMTLTQQRSTRPRFQFTPQHKELLESVYQTSAYPDKTSKQQIAALIGATEIQVNEWFQRRRKKDPAISTKMAANISNTGSHTSQFNAMPIISNNAFTNLFNSGNATPTQNISTAPSVTTPQVQFTSSAITSPFLPYSGSVNPPIPNHEVYVYIGDSQGATTNSDNKSEKRDEKNMSTDTSRQLIESIMPYLKSDLGLISSQVVYDFLHKVKDAPLSARGSILHIIDQTKDNETLKCLVNERVCYLLRNWIKEEAKLPDSDLLLKLLQTVNHLPIDTEALSSSGLGRVVNNTRVKDSQIPGVSALASLLINKWIEEKRRIDVKVSTETTRPVATSSSNIKTITKSSTPISSKSSNQSSQSSQMTSKLIKGRDSGFSRFVKPEQKTKEIDPKIRARPDASLFDEILGNLSMSKPPTKQMTQTNNEKQASHESQDNERQSTQSTNVQLNTSSLGSTVQKSSSMEIIEDSPTTNLRDNNRKEIKSVSSKKRKRVTFATELTQVRLFEDEEPEELEFSTANTPHQFGNARDLDRNEGLTAFKREERERQILEAIYITSDQVPFSPAEPDENLQPHIKSREIALYEEFNNEHEYDDRTDSDFFENDLDSSPSEELLRTLHQEWKSRMWYTIWLGECL